MTTPPPRKTPGSIMITQAIAVVGFVIVPGLVTWIAPRTTIQLATVNQQPKADVVKYIFLWVPYSHVTIAPLESARSIVTAADRHISREERRRGRTGVLLADGSVLLAGGGQETQVQSTPTAAPLEAKEISAFIAAPESAPKLMTATAGWQMTYLLGGTMTALAAFYCLGACLAIVKWFATLWLPQQGMN
jgi:hypothetical protein